MPESYDYADVRHTGAHRFDSIVLPADSVGDTQHTSSAPVRRAALKHEHRALYAQADGSAAASAKVVVHVARAAGVVVGVYAGPGDTAAVGGATVTVDALKNGSSVLSSTIVIDNGDAAYATVAGTVNTSVDDYVSGNVFEIQFTAAAGGGTLPQGCWAVIVLEEAAA